jgi:HSP20 family protein
VRGAGELRGVRGLLVSGVFLARLGVGVPGLCLCLGACFAGWEPLEAIKLLEQPEPWVPGVRRPRRRRSVFSVFGGLLRELEERLAEVEDEMERVFRRALAESGSAGPYIYGIRITIGPGGVPRAGEFGGTTRGRRGRPLIKEEAEPLVDVIERGGEVWVVADLPGVPKENIDVRVTERTVTIRARSGGRRYHKVVELPAEVVPESARASYKNGVLEIRLKKKGGSEEKGFKVQIE